MRKYDELEIEIIKLSLADIIATSGGGHKEEFDGKEDEVGGEDWEQI